VRIRRRERRGHQAVSRALRSDDLPAPLRPLRWPPSVYCRLGNDRVLVYNEIPRENGARADAILGQQGEFINAVLGLRRTQRVSSTDSFKTPHSLAWDGVNLYVADTFNRRVLLYSPADFFMPLSACAMPPAPGLRKGFIVFTGELVKDDEITLTFGRQGDEDSKRNYKYKSRKRTTFAIVINAFTTSSISRTAATPSSTPFRIPFNAIMLTPAMMAPSAIPSPIERANSNDTSLTLITLSGATLTGGQDAAQIAPYALVAMLGDNLTDFTSEVRDLSEPLPYQLANTQVYFDGKLAPLVLCRRTGSSPRCPSKWPTPTAPRASSAPSAPMARHRFHARRGPPDRPESGVFDTNDSVPARLASPSITHPTPRAPFRWTASTSARATRPSSPSTAATIYIVKEHPDRLDEDGEPTTDTAAEVVQGLVEPHQCPRPRGRSIPRRHLRHPRPPPRTPARPARQRHPLLRQGRR
jgi:hypothetical protein